jgi:hypothetical protein
MNQIIDQLAMLLSTDWFLGQWTLFGMKSDVPAREAMKEKCRTIVSQLFNGESDYWLVSFEDARIRNTYDSFFSAAVESKLHTSDIEFLREIADQTQGEMKEANNTSLLKSLTQLLVSDSSPGVVKNLSSEVVAAIASTFAATSVNEVDFVPLCLISNTDWDKKIRDMTSGLPEYLADFASDVCERMLHFVQFWRQLNEKISLNERAQLLEWYSDTALELTKRNLEFPRWM